MSSLSVLWSILIGTFFVVNFFLLQFAATPELMHGVIVTNVQLIAAALSVAILLRPAKPKQEPERTAKK